MSTIKVRAPVAIRARHQNMQSRPFSIYMANQPGGYFIARDLPKYSSPFQLAKCPLCIAQAMRICHAPPCSVPDFQCNGEVLAVVYSAARSNWPKLWCALPRLYALPYAAL